MYKAVPRNLGFVYSSVGNKSSPNVVYRIMFSLYFVMNTTFPYAHYTEAEFLDVIGTKVFRVFLLIIHSYLYQYCNLIKYSRASEPQLYIWALGRKQRPLPLYTVKKG
jgi:hypothetical protein